MKKNAHKVDITDQQIEAGLAEARRLETREPRVIKASYAENDDQVRVEFADGMTLLVPRKHLQGLQGARATELAVIHVVGGGSGLRWPKLDVDHYVPGLLSGIFGTLGWMKEIGRRGGAVRSKAKAAAARRNGLKGGRPARVRTAAQQS